MINHNKYANAPGLPRSPIFLQNANIFIHSTVSGIYKYKYPNSPGLSGSLISSLAFLFIVWFLGHFSDIISSLSDSR